MGNGLAIYVWWLNVLWFVDSFDHYNIIGPKYANPDNPNLELEFQTGTINTTLKRTGKASFLGTIQKWHGANKRQVIMGISFHSSNVSTGEWIRHFATGTENFYSLVYDGTNLIAEGLFFQIAIAPITIIEGWNRLEWRAQLHNYSLGDNYEHEVRLNGIEVFLDSTGVVTNGGNHYTTILPEIGNVDDYVVIHPTGGIHTGFLGNVTVHNLKPIGNGSNSFQSFFSGIQEADPDNYQAVNRSTNDDVDYIFDKNANEKDTFQVKVIDPAILGIFGFQYNNYCRIHDTTIGTIGIGPQQASATSLTLRHHYSNPEGIPRFGEVFTVVRDYQYRTSFVEWDLDEIESGHPNNGIYVNNSFFGVRIQSGGDKNARISQFSIEIVLPFIVDDPDPPDPPDISIPSSASFTLAKLWKISLLSGVDYYFTNHNIEIDKDGQSYTPIGSFITSALRRKTGIDPTDAEADGFLETLLFNDFLSGKMRGASIVEYIVDWKYPWAGVITTHKQVISSYGFDGAKWKVALSSISEKLLLPKGDIYGRTCRHVLGDTKCKVPIDDLKHINVLALIPVGRIGFNALVGGSGIDAFGNDVSVNSYFDFGNLIFTSGAGENNGEKHEIRTSTILDPVEGEHQFVLQVPTTFDIIPGSRFDLWPGCNKLYATCKDKFENAVDGDSPCGNTKNFGGFPTIPGKDGRFAPITGAKRVKSFRHLDAWGAIEDWLLGGLF